MKCKDCDKAFIQEKDDLMPARRCPDCRVKILLSFRNERCLHKRKCDLCQQEFIGTYPEASLYKVYCSKCWWSDKWDAFDYGIKFDDNKKFLKQFKELYLSIPHLGMIMTNSVNSDFCNFSDKLKDCFLVVNAEQDENLYYCERVFYTKDSIDCNGLTNCQLCYWCTSCRDCYNTRWCEFCENCTDCDFCYECKGCQNCFGSFGLRNQKYVYFNQQLTEEEYKEKIKNINFNNIKHECYKHWLKYPHRYASVINCENATGDNITRLKKCSYVFDADEMENCKYCYVGVRSKEAQYCVPADEAEHCYNSMSTWQTHDTYCSNTCWYGSDIMYSFQCMSSQDLFGCVGLQKAEYCILNKQYSKAEYQIIKKQIINQLKRDNIYGEYFPVDFSPYPYHETIAQEHYPRKIKQNNEGATALLHLHICKTCNKNFKILTQEQELYKRLKVVEPVDCPKCRYGQRFKRRNPRKLYERECMNKNCNNKIMSSYSVNSLERIYCNKCYMYSVV